MRYGVTDNIAPSPYLGWLQAFIILAVTLHQLIRDTRMCLCPQLCVSAYIVWGLWSIVLLWTPHFWVIWPSLMKQQIKKKNNLMGFFLLENKFTKVSKLYSGTKRGFNIYQNDHPSLLPFNYSLVNIFEEKVTIWNSLFSNNFGVLRTLTTKMSSDLYLGLLSDLKTFFQQLGWFVPFESLCSTSSFLLTGHLSLQKVYCPLLNWSES